MRPSLEIFSVSNIFIIKILSVDLFKTFVLKLYSKC